MQCDLKKVSFLKINSESIKEFLDLSDIDDSSSEIIEEVVSSNICPFCTYFTDNLAYLLHHIVFYHGYENAVYQEFCLSVSSKSNEVICKKCLSTSNEKDDFLVHCLNEHTSGVLQILKDSAYKYQKIIEEGIISTVEKYSIEPEASDITTQELCAKEVIIEPKASVITPIKLSNIINSKTRFNQEKSQAYLNDLASFETFLRKNRLILYVQSENKCALCNKSFPSSMLLVQHSYNEHRPSITHNTRKVLSLMSNFYIDEISDIKLFEIPELRLDFLMFNQQSMAFSLSPDRYSVQSIVLDMILDVFGNEKNKTFDINTKKWNNYKATLQLHVSFPITINTLNARFSQILFHESKFITGREYKEVLELVIRSFLDRIILVVDVTNVHQNFVSTKQIASLRDEYGVYVLKMESQSRDFAYVRSVQLICYTESWRNNKEEFLKNGINSAYQQNELVNCCKCKTPYILKDGGECKNASIAGLKITLSGTKHEPLAEPYSSITFKSISLQAFLGY